MWRNSLNYYFHVSVYPTYRKPPIDASSNGEWKPQLWPAKVNKDDIDSSKRSRDSLERKIEEPPIPKKQKSSTLVPQKSKNLTPKPLAASRPMSSKSDKKSPLAMNDSSSQGKLMNLYQRFIISHSKQ